jgi:hypothetical protein
MCAIISCVCLAHASCTFKVRFGCSEELALKRDELAFNTKCIRHCRRQNDRYDVGYTPAGLVILKKGKIMSVKS